MDCPFCSLFSVVCSLFFFLYCADTVTSFRRYRAAQSKGRHLLADMARKRNAEGSSDRRGTAKSNNKKLVKECERQKQM